MGLREVKWKINNIPLSQGPTTFNPSFNKKSHKKKLIDGTSVRIIPPKNYVDGHIEVTWRMAKQELKDLLSELFVSDSKFILQSHIEGNPRDIWTVRMDEFEPSYAMRGASEQRWDIRATLRVVDGFNDPIIREREPSFVVNNKTNRVVTDFHIFFRPISETVKNPFIKQRFLNLLENPSFEDKLEGWNVEQGVWNSNIIYSYPEGRSIFTSGNGSKISQEVPFVGGQHLTFSGAFLGSDVGCGCSVAIFFLNKNGEVIGDSQHFLDAGSGNKFKINWFSTPNISPAETVKAQIILTNTSTSGKRLYVDQLLLKAGKAENAPRWVGNKHLTLTYNGELNEEEVLRINTATNYADINGFENVRAKLKGDFFSLPAGMSVLEIGSEEGQFEAVIRYDEVWN